MATRHRRTLVTGILLFVHAHSLVFFVGLLCVASNDLDTPNSTNSTNLTTILPTAIPAITLSPINSTSKSTKKPKSKKSTTPAPALSSTATTTADSVNELTETTIETPESTLEKDRWQNFDIQRAKNADLQAYKLYLEQELANVTQFLDDPEKKSKRYIPLPVSSSLPDYISSVVRSRVNASSVKSAENTTQINESKSSPAGKKSLTKDDDEPKGDDQKSAEEDEKFTDSGTKTSDKELAIVREESSTEDPDNSKSKHKLFGVQTTHLTDMQAPDSNEPQNRRSSFEPTQNHTAEDCKRLTQAELVSELKQKGSYNPNLMAWDVAGVFRFLDRSIVDQYERQIKSHKSNKQVVQRNVEALERILAELNLHCDVRSPDVLTRLGNLTLTEPRRTVMSPSIRMSEEEVRFKRNILADDLLRAFNSSRSKDDPPSQNSKRQKMIGDVHVVPFGCDKRGEEEDGYLRLCGACQAIRKLPDTFFPPFINEVTCDTDKACMYFYDYPHGKCKQKHMNFVVLRNVGTSSCQVWQKFNLNVRVSCECFVDSMSFFSKYV